MDVYFWLSEREEIAIEPQQIYNQDSQIGRDLSQTRKVYELTQTSPEISSCQHLRSIYELDHQLGLDYFTTTTPGLGGKLRERLDDFIVTEIPIEIPRHATGEYTHFTLEKRNWETAGAIGAIAKATGVSHMRFSYAGNKDKRALTAQRVSAWRIQEERLLRIAINGIRLYDFNKSNFKLNTGDLKGNKFRIVVRGFSENGERLATVARAPCEQIEANGIPNYYGYQRFGTVRPNTHLVGKELVEGNWEAAVLQYLGRPFDTEPEDSKHARRFLDETRDFRSALEHYPQRLTYERMMLAALAKNPVDYTGALRRLPRSLRRLLVHAYQAYLFNRMLSMMLEVGEDIRHSSLPVVGHRTSFSGGRLGDVQRTVLGEEGVSPENFRIHALPELSSEGTIRPAFIDVSPTFQVDRDRGELNNPPSVTIDFTLPPACYATVVLREFMKVDPLNY